MLLTFHLLSCRFGLVEGPARIKSTLVVVCSNSYVFPFDILCSSCRFGLVEEPAPMNSTLVVPRIIHQTWKTEEVPEIWAHARK